MTALVVIAGLGLGLGLAYASYQARLGLLAWLAWQREAHKPLPAANQPDAALVDRLSAVESELARFKMEKLTGRR